MPATGEEQRREHILRIGVDAGSRAAVNARYGVFPNQYDAADAAGYLMSDDDQGRADRAAFLDGYEGGWNSRLGWED